MCHISLKIPTQNEENYILNGKRECNQGCVGCVREKKSNRRDLIYIKCYLKQSITQIRSCMELEFNSIITFFLQRKEAEEGEEEEKISWFGYHAIWCLNSHRSLYIEMLKVHSILNHTYILIYKLHFKRESPELIKHGRFSFLPDIWVLCMTTDTNKYSMNF